MIIGIGHDLTTITRVATILEGKAGSRFLQRVLTESERNDIELLGSQSRIAEFVAGRFAAKEAISKALGCGIGGVLGFHDMVTERLESGKPHCTISEGAKLRLNLSHRNIVIHLSITHERDHASAFAIVEEQ